jgi:uncharacterized membrane protein
MMLRYLFASLLLLLLDSIFLKWNERMFHNQVIHVQRVILQPNYYAIIVTYLFLLFGLCYFIIRPHKSVIDAFLLGLFVYGVFEFTNMSIFKKWELKTALIDTLWGGILFALVTQCTYFYFSR